MKIFPPKVALVTCVLLLSSNTSFADYDTGPTKTVYCPAANELVLNKKTLKYYFGRSWGSYAQSFVRTVTQFKGAQWQGTNIGHVVCVYKGEPLDSTFPIQLYLEKLTNQPTKGNWSAHSGGYFNCPASDPKQCPIVMRTPKKQGNIYQQAEDVKKNAPPPSILKGY